MDHPHIQHGKKSKLSIMPHKKMSLILPARM